MTDQTTVDAALDRQYRLGYEQAWREWSGLLTPLLFGDFQKVSNADVSAMERRRARVAQRDKENDT